MGNETGPGTGDIMGDALSQSMFAGDDIDPNDEMDGFGALTGAIDQLAFTHDLDFSGDGVDDDPMKQVQQGAGGAPNTLAPPGRNNAAAAEAKRKRLKKKRAEAEGHDNPAFLDDEQLLLAASLVPTGEDSDSDTDLVAARRLTQPRIIIQAETPAAATAAATVKTVPVTAKTAPSVAKDPKGKTTNKEPPPPPILPQPRLPSAKVRRIGSARRTPAKFTMTFTQKYTPIPPTVPRGVPPPPPPAAGTPAAPTTQAPPPPKPAATQPDSKGKKVEAKEKKGEKEMKRQATAAVEEEQSQEDKWAEKKGKGSRNKVAPSTSSSLEEGSEARAKDDLGVGLATEEGQEAKAEQRQRPKTSVAPSQKMKQRATQEVGNMNTILPWDNEDGDIK